jgi:hypothetical protein
LALGFLVHNELVPAFDHFGFEAFQAIGVKFPFDRSRFVQDLSQFEDLLHGHLPNVNFLVNQWFQVLVRFLLVYLFN